MHPRFADESDPYYGKWVADISCVTANGPLLRKYLARKHLLHRLESARGYIHALKATGAVKYKYAEQRLQSIENKLSALITQSSDKYNPTIIAAYVTFNNLESVQRCVDDYDQSWNWWHPNSWAQPEPLRLRGHTLRVSPAPDPSRILWHHLDVPVSAQRTRNAFTAIAAVVIMLACFVVIMLAQGFQVKYRSQIPTNSMCRVTLPAIAYGEQLTSSGVLHDRHDMPADLTLVRNATDPTCPQGSRVYWTSGSLGAPLSNATATNPCYNDCFQDSKSEEVCEYGASDGGTLYVPKDTAVGCYCLARIQSALTGGATIQAIQSVFNSEKDFCAGFVRVRLLTAMMVT